MSAEPETNTNSSLVGMFLSGRKSQQGADGDMQGVTTQQMEDHYREVEYFPDPPCIAPFEEDDEEHGHAVRTASGTNPQEYWKNHATWQQEDPEVQAQRVRFEEFIKLYSKKLGLDQQDNLDASAKKIRRNLTALASRGDLNGVDAFVNISQNSVGVRKTSSFNDEEKTGEVVKPGECVVVDKVVEDSTIRFLHLADGRGWIFDRNQDVQVMAKMDEVEVCKSWYRTLCKEMVDVRRTPIYDEVAKTGRLLSSKELVVVNLKCRIRGQGFVHLADGRGWVFLMKPGSDKKKRTYADTVMQECDQEIVRDQKGLDPAELLPSTSDAVEVGLWTYIVGEEVLALGSKLHGTYLTTGEVLKVDKRAYSNGDPVVPGFDSKRWLRLMDGRGWVPEKGTNGRSVVVLQGSAVGGYPGAFRKKDKSTDPASSGWKIGVA